MTTPATGFRRSLSAFQAQLMAVAGLLALLLPLGALAQTAGPTLTTDKPDYAPGEYVTFTGTGWQPGETVLIEVYETSVDPSFDEGGVTAIADANGSISNSDFLVQQSFLGQGFLANAAGQISGLTAQTTFTDKSSSTTTAGSSPNPSCLGQSVTITATVAGTGSVNPTGTVQFQTNGVNFGAPVNVTASGNHNAVASLTTNSLASGNNALTAVYSGDGNYTGSTSPATNQWVGAPAAAGQITGPTPTCSGQTASYSITKVNAATGYNWSVSTIDNSASITAGQNTTNVTIAWGSTSGMLTVTPNNSCADGASSSLNVTVNPAPTANAGGPLTICKGSSTTIGGSPTASGGTGSYTYSWAPTTGLSPSATNANPTASPTTTTTYTVVVTDAVNGCKATNSMTLTVNTTSAPPTSATAGLGTICNGSSTSLTLSGGGGGSNQVVAWYAGSCGGTFVGNGNGLSVSPTTTTTYYGRYEDGAPCNFATACASVTVTVNQTSAPPTSATAAANPICKGQSTTLTLNGGGGGSSEVIHWYSSSCGSGSVGTGNNLSVHPTTTTTYYGRYEDGSPCNFNTTCASVTLMVNQTSSPPTTISASPSTICNGQSSSLSLSGGGGGSNQVIAWYSGSCGGTFVGTGSPLSVTPTATTTYYGRYEDGGPCNLNSTCLSVTVTVNQKSADPTSATASVNPSCSGSPTTLTLNGGGGGGTSETIHWYTGSCGGTPVGTGNGLTVNPATTTTYYGRYEDGAPCNYVSACAAVTITVDQPPPDCSITGDDAVPANSTGNTFSGAPGMSAYSWTVSSGGTITAGANSQIVTVSAGAATSFTVTNTVVGANGCQNSCTKTVVLTSPFVPGSLGTSTSQQVKQLTLTANASVPVGNTIFVEVVMDATNSSVTVTDTVNNVYSNDADVMNDGALRTIVFSAPVSTALPAGGSITVFFPSPPTNKAASFFSYKDLLAVSYVDKSSTRTSSGPDNFPNSGATAATSQNDELLLGALAVADNGVAFASYSNSFAAVPSSSVGISSLFLQPTYAVTNATGQYYAAGNYTTNKNNPSSPWAAAIVTYKRMVPSVVAIGLPDPTPSNAGSVHFTVQFSERVYNVNANDFQLMPGSISDASVSGVTTADGTNYTVTVNTGTGNGTIGLNVGNYDNAIVDIDGAPLGGTGAAGTQKCSPAGYTICKTVAMGCPPSPPAFQCASDVPGHATNYASFTGQGGSASSLCDGISVTWVGDAISGQTCANRYTISRTYQATDSLGNTATCTQTITVNDTTQPSVSKGSIAGCFKSLAEAKAAALLATTGTGGCGDALGFTASDNGQTCPATITVTGTDGCGNSASVSYTATILTAAPTLSGCPTPATLLVHCPAEIPAAATVTATDACGSPLSVTPGETQSNPNGCTNIITRTWTVTDCAGNVNSCSQTITLHQDAVPTLTKGSIAACYKSLAEADAAAKTATTGSSACGGTPTFTVTDNNQTCPATITVTGTDACGNSASVSYTATILGSAPTFTGVPANASYECLASVPAPASVSAADACGSALSVGYNAVTNGSTCAMTITRTWSVTDCAGNPASASQTIAVTNDLPPTVTAGTLANTCFKTLAAAEDAAVAATSTTSNCGDTPTLTPSASGTCPTVITVTAADACGNHAAVHYNVTILGSAPSFTGVPADASYECLASVLPPASVSAADACGRALSVGYSAVTNGSTCAMTITRTWSATDCAGNPASASQTIAVTNDLPPTVTAGTLATTCFKTLAAAEDAAVATTSATSNCGDTPTLTPSASGTCPTVITVTAADACGNHGAVHYNVTILGSAPTFTGVPANASYECLASVPAPASVSAADACGSALSVGYSGVTNGSTCAMTITRTWSATDCAGNPASASQTIAVTNDLPPTVTAGTLANTCFKTLAAAEDAAVAATSATSNCGDTPTLTPSASGTCPTVITVTATDACGNHAAVHYNVTILSSAPAFTGVPANANYECPASVPAPASVSAADACGSALSVGYSAVTNGSGCAMTITRTWSATDCAGNPATASQTIAVTNDLPPTVTAGTLATTCFKTLAAAEDAAVAATSATSNCGDTPTLMPSASGTCPTLITVTATDACGNHAAVHYNVTILGSAPTFTGVPANANYECLASVPAPASVSAADACGSALSVGYSAVTNGSACAMTITRTWLATDCAGNPASASQTIAVTNDLPPTVTAGALASSCFKTLAAAEDAAVAATSATSNCGDTPTLTPSASGTCPTVITITATDACGNHAAVHYNVTILGSAPAFTGVPANANYECVASVPAPPTVSAADACGSAISVGYSAATNGSACAMTITRTWSATDCAGNPASTSQIIAVTNDLPPTVTAGTLATTCFKTLAAAEDAAVAATSATSNCGDTPTLTPSASGTCPTVITVTATDACGNHAAVHYNVTILGSAPTFTGVLANASYECLASVPAPASVSATDACGSALSVGYSAVTNGSACAMTITRTWSATDCAGNPASAAQTIAVTNDLPPTITAGTLANSCFKTLAAAEDAAVAATSATSNCGDTPTLTPSASGTCPTVITVTAADACGNHAAVHYNVTILGSAPALTGVPANASYECLASVPAPASASAADACGSALSVGYSAVTNGTACAMTITRTWSATDCAGNPASASQTIAVTNDLPPTVTAGALATTCFKTLAAAKAAALAATTASSNCGDLPTLTPSASATCPTVITVRATDACGNHAAVQYTVTILSTLPVLSGCPAGTTNYECYASVPAAATVTAKDACGAVLPVTPNETQTNPGSSSNNIITRTWTATDCAGNVSSCTQTITVNDDQAPTILPNSANPMAVTLNTAYVEPGVTAGDNCGVVTVTTNGAVNTTVVGTYTVTYTATDSCGNRSTATRTVNVSGTQYQAAGKSCVVNGVLCPGHVILQPVNADGTSSFKQGSTVPCKFMVFDANCNSVGTPGVVTSFTLVNTSGGAPGVNESVTSTTPDTAFRWDSTAQQWIFNLNTKNLPKNTTFTYIISLNDGSNIQFSFGLK